MTGVFISQYHFMTNSKSKDMSGTSPPVSCTKVFYVFIQCSSCIVLHSASTVNHKHINIPHSYSLLLPHMHMTGWLMLKSLQNIKPSLPQLSLLLTGCRGQSMEYSD